MKVATFLLLVNTYTFATLQNDSGRAKNYENLLLDTIFKNYDKMSRPVEDYHSPLEVNFSISLQQILKVDEKNQIITTNLWRSSFWKDDFLQWNPKNFGNITQVCQNV